MPRFVCVSPFFAQNNYATRNTNFSHKCDGTIFLMRNMGTNVCRSCNVMSCDVIVIIYIHICIDVYVCELCSIFTFFYFRVMKLPLLAFWYDNNWCLQVASIVLYNVHILLTHAHMDNTYTIATSTINAACVCGCVYVSGFVCWISKINIAIYE